VAVEQRCVMRFSVYRSVRCFSLFLPSFLHIQFCWNDEHRQGWVADGLHVSVSLAITYAKKRTSKCQVVWLFLPELSPTCLPCGSEKLVDLWPRLKTRISSYCDIALCLSAQYRVDWSKAVSFFLGCLFSEGKCTSRRVVENQCSCTSYRHA